MKWKQVLRMGMLGLGCLGMAACGTTKKVEPRIEEIYAQTHIAPSGQTLDKIVYKLNTIDSNSKFTKDDFKVVVTNTIVDWNTKEETVSEVSATIEKVTVEDNSLILDLANLPYKTITDITVEGQDDFYNSTFKDYKIMTKTVDDFKKATFKDSHGTELTYWLYIPKTQKNVPLVIWEHGGGEVLASSFEGSNLVASQGATAWIENGYKTAVLSVQYPENYSFGISEISDEMKKMGAFNTAKYELVQSLIKDGVVNKNMVYVTGASSGGGGALRFGMQYPDLFAGALVVSAKDTIVPISKKYDLAYQLDDPAKLKITDQQYAETYAAMETELAKYPDTIEVPIWFVHAKNDQVTTSYTSIMMEDILKKMGAKKNKITLYSDEEMEKGGVHSIYHGSWQLAYQDKDMLDWLMSLEN